MTDRNVQFPNRYRMVKVAGTDDIFDVIPAPGEVFEEGDFLNKNSLLKDTTADLYGLGADALPDEVLAWIGKYNMHWWRKRRVIYSDRIDGDSSETGYFLQSAPSSAASALIKYSENAHIDTVNKKIVLDAPVNSFYCSYNNKGQLSVDTKFYIQRSPHLPDRNKYDTFYGRLNDIAVSKSYNPTTYNTYIGSGGNRGNGVFVQTFISGYGDWEYMHSTNRNAYPDVGIADGYEYEYLGIPFDNFVTAPKIADGFYMGTGMYGLDNPNSLTFPFAPKIVLLTNLCDTRDGSLSPLYRSDLYWIINSELLTDSYQKNIGFGVHNSSNGGVYAKISPDRKTIYWYTKDNNQFNNNFYKYFYIAIG